MKPATARGPLIIGALAVTLALGWQALAVRYNYGGNWTSFFCTGGDLRQPPSLASEDLYSFPNSFGYDGQFYHYVAHDPLFRRGLDQYIDAPRLRYRRILVPALASIAALGHDAAIDPALVGVNLLFLFAGVYWLSRYIAGSGHYAAWGLLFLLAPAVLVSLDRLTVDLALTALSMGFALYVAENQPRRLYAILVLAPLARETGLLLTAAYSISQFAGGRLKTACLFATSALPALAWYAFVQSQTSPYSVASWFTLLPFGGLVDRMIHPMHYPFGTLISGIATGLDEVALAGMLMAFVLAFWLLKAQWLRPLQIAIALIALSGLNLGKPFWEEAYAFGRVFSPLLAILALRSCSAPSWVPILPLAMIVPRIGLQLGGQIVKVARGLFM